MRRDKKVLLAFGSNMAGAWGSPDQAIQKAFRYLADAGIALERISSLFATEPMGPRPQATYANAAALGATALSAIDTLHALQALEHAAGRRPGPRWGPRPLDIDILDYEGTILGWDHPHDPMSPAELVLPHPELHKRRFVLEPLLDIAPEWRHPVFGSTPAEMLARLGG
jgi:2-amino-4-hydroxy-6-hydroxymethyldihydropteridine diphosphokinase